MRTRVRACAAGRAGGLLATQQQLGPVAVCLRAERRHADRQRVPLGAAGAPLRLRDQCTLRLAAAAWAGLARQLHLTLAAAGSMAWRALCRKRAMLLSRRLQEAQKAPARRGLGDLRLRCLHQLAACSSARHSQRRVDQRLGAEHFPAGFAEMSARLLQARSLRAVTRRLQAAAAGDRSYPQEPRCA